MIELLKWALIGDRVNEHEAVSVLYVVVPDGDEGLLASRVGDVEENAVALLRRHPLRVRILDRRIIALHKDSLQILTYKKFAIGLTLV